MFPRSAHYNKKLDGNKKKKSYDTHRLAELVRVHPVKGRLHRRFLSQQLNATQCNFCRIELLRQKSPV